MTRADIATTCFWATRSLYILDRTDAAWLADQVVDLIIKALRSDPGVPRLTSEVWTLKFADLRQEIESTIGGLTDDRVDVRDAVEAIVDQLQEDGVISFGAQS
jgi:hypothetical protein